MGCKGLYSETAISSCVCTISVCRISETISMKMTDFDLDETYEAKVCAVKCAWQEAQQAVNAQRDTIEGAKVLGVIVWTMCRVHIIR